MAAICLSPRGSHVGLKSYMAGPCDQARVVLSSNSWKSPACLCCFDQTPASIVNANQSIMGIPPVEITGRLLARASDRENMNEKEISHARSGQAH